ncbi:MAG: hydroxypyruvate isomerase [Alphaproteobacteria bacterium]|nr:hydroxypyruvate isomerase [Alphaproteobacteria bacterium]
MLRFCANLGWLFTEHAFWARFAAAAQAGFKGVEFSQPYEHPAGRLAEALQSNGLEMVLFNLPAGDWAAGERGIACHPGRVDEFREGVARAVQYAKALNCRRINCLAGIAPADVPQTRLWETLAANLHFAAEALARENIELMVEPINRNEMPGFFLNTSAQGLQAIAAAGHPNIKLQYDIYHMQRAEGELAATIARLLPVIGHMQLADNPGRHEPGTGEINFPFLLRHIEALGYDGWMGCEYAPLNGTAAGLGWMR